MYTFRLLDEDVHYDINANKNMTSIPVEFNVITKEEGCDIKKFTKIKKPDYQLQNRKPRNAFLIFRGIVRKPIIDLIDDKTFVEVSKLSSLLWSKRTLDLEKYMKYLAKQDERYWTIKSEIKHSSGKYSIKKVLKKHPNPLIFISGNNDRPKKRLFRHYRVNKSTLNFVIRSQKDSKDTISRVQDVFISQNQ